MPMTTVEVPDVIYLQIDEDEVSWCHHRVHESDVEFIQVEPQIKSIVDVLKRRLEKTCAKCGEPVDLYCEECQ